MDQYIVTGMTCAACQARVEKAVGKVEGVDSCSVSLLTNSMGVEGSASPSDIIQAVMDAGYGAELKGGADASGRTLADSGKGISAKMAAQEDALRDRETPKLRRRLIASVGFLLILMYFSMGHMMLGWPLPAFYNGNHVAMGLTQLLLSAIVMVINQKFFTSGFKSLFHGAPNMDTLIALGSSAAFVYSTAMLFAMTRAQVDGNSPAVMKYMMEFYFESAAMILALITVGKMLEAYSKGKTTNALKSLMKLAPKTAIIERDGHEVEVSIDEVRRGDIFLVKPGENIPVDGVIIEGNSALNESAITGESIPVDKGPGDGVTSATLNQSGFLRCEATRVGEDTTLSQIIQMVSDAAATKAPVAKLADRISGVFVPVVIAIALFTFIIWLLVGQTFGFAIARGICVLVVSCPCALGLATPVAIMVGNGVGAKNGILFKNSEALQETGNVQIIALDKTGTITRGEPVVTDLVPAQGFSEEELLALAVSLEKKSEHPLAKAVIAEGEERKIEADQVEDFRALPGNGLTGYNSHLGQRLTGGNLAFIRDRVPVDEKMIQAAGNLADQGKTPLFFSCGDRLAGIIAVADTMKEDSPKAIAELKNMGLHVVMLTGDNQKTADAIGKQAGVDEVIAGVLPDGKEAVIKQLQDHGRVAMVGDGINDAPALTRAEIGIAIGAGTDVAIDAADVVLMKSVLSDVTAAIRLSRQTYRNILENLFWALIYNVALIPVAAGAYAHFFGITMDPMFGAAAMSLSSFCVCMNALRLNLFKVHDASKDKARKNRVKVNADGKLLSADEKTKSADSIENGIDGQAITMNTDNKETMNINDPEHKQDPDTLTSGKGQEMTKTITIEGMMCGHCEATVKKALEKLDQVNEAQVSHEKGTAVVSLKEEVDDDLLKKTVEDKDYTVVSIA